jgi:DNA-binding response OmpR family regulator
LTDRVLIIDDDESFAAMLAEYLEGHSLEVEHALPAIRRAGFPC